MVTVRLFFSRTVDVVLAPAGSVPERRLPLALAGDAKCRFLAPRERVYIRDLNGGMPDSRIEFCNLRNLCDDQCMAVHIVAGTGSLLFLTVIVRMWVLKENSNLIYSFIALL